MIPNDSQQPSNVKIILGKLEFISVLYEIVVDGSKRTSDFDSHTVHILKQKTCIKGSSCFPALVASATKTILSRSIFLRAS